MAITVTTPAVSASSEAGFIANGTSADMSGCEELVAAPGTGISIYLRHLTISCQSAITVTIGEGETTPGSVDSALIGPIAFTTTANPLQLNFAPGAMKLTAAKSLTVDASGAGAVTVFAQGYLG